MSDTESTNVLAGRARHLGELAQVFRHRHGTWRDFGAFLKREFLDDSDLGGMVGATSGLPRMACRHNVGGRNHAALSTAVAAGANAVPFNHERYSRPCRSHGAFELNGRHGGKNGGLVVHNLCTRAAAFLRSIGKGDPHESTGRDFDYDPGLYPASSTPLLGSSRASDVSGDDLVMLLQDDGSTLTQAAFAASEDSRSDEFDDGGFFDDEDVQAVLGIEDVVDGSEDDELVDLSDLPLSQDSFEQLVERGSSLKMRAATLAYLWGCADDVGRLKREFRRLRSMPELCVLHLCGCGLCFKSADGRNIVGCAEWSHLKLGSKEENGRHRTYHHMLELLPAADYVAQVDLIHRGTDGDGIF